MAALRRASLLQRMPAALSISLGQLLRGRAAVPAKARRSQASLPLSVLSARQVGSMAPTMGLPMSLAPCSADGACCMTACALGSRACRAGVPPALFPRRLQLGAGGPGLAGAARQADAQRKEARPQATALLLPAAGAAAGCQVSCIWSLPARPGSRCQAVWGVGTKRLPHLSLQQPASTTVCFNAMGRVHACTCECAS